MTREMPLAAMASPLMALRIFEGMYRHLPAPCVSISTVCPNLLELSFYEDADGFETWCQALGIPLGKVAHSVHADGHTSVMKAVTNYSGGPVKLICFTTIPASEEARSWAEVAS
ncbi:hypothetical protein [Streptomyces virginiae]|uniref:hypothetical protein n=1 Tax=Streptomyces virginiae TaxID=1961 RepID=UPI0004CC203E|nr:hypothetical protein [Streptomyces virginiae]